MGEARGPRGWTRPATAPPAIGHAQAGSPRGLTPRELRSSSGTWAWGEALGVTAQVFVVGFACGGLAWAGRGIGRRFGARGDALFGLVTAMAFLSSCLFLLDREMFGSRFRAEALRSLVPGALLGARPGVLIGGDLRRESPSAARARSTDSPPPAAPSTRWTAAGTSTSMPTRAPASPGSPRDPGVVAGVLAESRRFPSRRCPRCSDAPSRSHCDRCSVAGATQRPGSRRRRAIRHPGATAASSALAALFNLDGVSAAAAIAATWGTSRTAPRRVSRATSSFTSDRANMWIRSRA